MDKPRRWIMPPAWLALALAAMWFLHRSWPGMVLVPRPWSWAGIALVLAGLAVILAGVGLFLRSDTGLIPFRPATALVTGSVFRYTRNPMYLGMATILAGVALLLGSATPWLALVAFIVIIDRRFIRAEEAFVEAAFGDEYRAYRARVRRWL